MSDDVNLSSSDDGDQIGHQQARSDAHQRTAADAVPLDVKQVTQELLKYGHIEESANSSLFQKAIAQEREIQAALAPLDLTLRMDTHRGIAFLAVAKATIESSESDQGWSHPLVRRQRLTLEQSLLVAILRQAFMIHEQESGIGQSSAKIAVEDLLSQFLTYFRDSGSDGRNESRLTSLLDQLKVHGIVSEVDNNSEVTIRPLIAHLANAESLSNLLRVLKEGVSSRELSGSENA